MGFLSPVSLDRVKPNSKKKIPAIGFTGERTKVLTNCVGVMSCDGGSNCLNPCFLKLGSGPYAFMLRNFCS